MRRCSLFLLLAAAVAHADDLPRGQIIDAVKCTADDTQSYALFLPSNYSPSRTWNLLLAFDPGGQGRRPVERFQAAAEKYGYIVAGSNNSRNGPPQLALAAAQAMTGDVIKRFNINERRVYTAGLSGGARIAMKVALDTDAIAGVVASSAGFPPGDRDSNLNFPVFGTAGTEDFNYLEMRQLDDTLSSPHRIAIFEGGHTWLPDDLALQAIEWMEIQAMKSGRRDHDEAVLKQIFAANAAKADAQKNDVAGWQTLNNLVEDFQGLTDVAKFATRADALHREKSVIDALNKERQEVEHEAQLDTELADLQEQLHGDANERTASLKQLGEKLPELASQANAAKDSAERRLARRLLSGVLADARGIEDAEYQKLIESLTKSPVK
jgi:poly(3-hydroxybutyrate) depolymerase